MTVCLHCAANNHVLTECQMRATDYRSDFGAIEILLLVLVSLV